MKSVLCIIAGMPQQLLADIVQTVAEESGGIEVVERINRIADIPHVVGSQPFDVLITAMTSSELPSSCVEFLDRFPSMSIGGLVDDGRRLAVYLDNAGNSDILKIIRALGG